MGFLLAGAASGGAGEYLKQSEEGRKAKIQEIRDRRLAEIARKESIRQEGVQAEAAKLERDFRASESKADRESADTRAKLDRESREKISQAEIEAKGPPTSETSRGAELGHWEKDAQGKWTYKKATRVPYEFAPSESSLKAAQTVYRMKPDGSRGAATTHEEITEEYLNDPAIWIEERGVDEFGAPTTIKKLRQGALGLTDYKNAKLHPDSRVMVNSPEALAKDPWRMWEYMQTTPQFKHPNGRAAALARVKEYHPWWSEDMGTPGAAAQQPEAQPPTTDLNPAARPGEPGYLETATAEQKASVTQSNAAAAAARAEAAAAQLGPASAPILESPLEIQDMIDDIEGKMKSASPEYLPVLAQQLQQYRSLLERSKQQRAAAADVGYPTEIPAP